MVLALIFPISISLGLSLCKKALSDCPMVWQFVLYVHGEIYGCMNSCHFQEFEAVLTLLCHYVLPTEPKYDAGT